MTWPFTARAVLKREQELLQARIRDLEAQLLAERAQTAYFRDRYERVADMVLFRAGETQTPIHVDPVKASGKTPIGVQVLRAAAAAGNDVGAFSHKQPNGSAADLPAR